MTARYSPASTGTDEREEPMTVETSVRAKIADEKAALEAELRNVAKLQKKILREYDRESAKRHTLALRILKYDREEDAPAKLRDDIAAADRRVNATLRSATGSEARTSQIQKKLDQLDDPRELSRRIEVHERLTALNERKKNTMATTTASRPQLSDADEKKIEKLANGNAPALQYARKVLKHKLGLRGTPAPIPAGLSTAKAAEIRKSLGVTDEPKAAKTKAAPKASAKTKTAAKTKTTAKARRAASRKSGSKTKTATSRASRTTKKTGDTNDVNPDPKPGSQGELPDAA